MPHASSYMSILEKSSPAPFPRYDHIFIHVTLNTPSIWLLQYKLLAIIIVFMKHPI